MTHTQGKLKQNYDDVYIGDDIEDVLFRAEWINDYNGEANARRLVACWNACDGLSTEALERFATLDRAGVASCVERDALKQANAELLEALQATLNTLVNANEQGSIIDTIWFSNYETLFDFIGAAIARAAIKRAEGGQTNG